MDKLKQNIDKIAKSFGYEYNDTFFSYLKSISKNNKQVCNKHVAKGEGGWKCQDCELDTLILICNDCFNKSKEFHKGHRIIFNPNSSGYCDCGDPNVIIKEGEQGNKFYILNKGEASAYKNIDGKDEKVLDYKPGSYFGELALIKNDLRAATIIANTDCNLLSLDRKSFKRLLGPLEQILTKNSELYVKYVAKK